MKNIIINICTYKRLELLEKCILSIASLQIPKKWHIQIVVIDNECNQLCYELLNNLSHSINIRIHYFSEPKLGIPFARNRACTESLNLNSDWIIFIDDDEIAQKDWLISYDLSIKKNQARIFTGPVKYIFPENYAKWLANKGLDNILDGDTLNRAATNNVMFSSSILRELSADKWFDENMKLIGGSDTEFFTRLVHYGEKIVFVKNAVMIEHVTNKRLSIKWRLGRQFLSSIIRIYVYSKLNGYKKSLLKYALEALRRVMDGLLGFSTIPIVALLPNKSIKKHIYHSLRHISKAAGLVVGLIVRNNLNFKRNY